MKNLAFGIILTFLLFPACGQNSTEPENQVEIKDIQTWSGCFADDTLADTYIIRTQEQYDSVLKLLNSCPENMPQTDFSKRTLLGLKIIEKGGFAPNLVETVLKNESAKTYTYHIDLEPNDDLQNYSTRIHWITIPKIEDNFSVKFEVNYNAEDVPVDKHNPFVRKFWLSSEQYGLEKIVFKKGEPIYLNYSAKNTTKKTYRWTADDDGPFGEFLILHDFTGAMFTNRKQQQWTPQNGDFKPGDEIRDAWRVGNEDSLTTGGWTAMAQAHWWFEGVPNYPWEIEFVIKE